MAQWTVTRAVKNVYSLHIKHFTKYFSILNFKFKKYFIMQKNFTVAIEATSN